MRLSEGWARTRTRDSMATRGAQFYLDGEHFAPGNLMMTTVLRILKHTTSSQATSASPLTSTAVLLTACLQASAGCSDWRFQNGRIAEDQLIGPVKAVALFRWTQIERIRNGKEHDLPLVR